MSEPSFGWTLTDNRWWVADFFHEAFFAFGVGKPENYLRELKVFLTNLREQPEAGHPEIQEHVGNLLAQIDSFDCRGYLESVRKDRIEAEKTGRSTLSGLGVEARARSVIPLARELIDLVDCWIARNGGSGDSKRVLEYVIWRLEYDEKRWGTSEHS